MDCDMSVTSVPVSIRESTGMLLTISVIAHRSPGSFSSTVPKKYSLELSSLTTCCTFPDLPVQHTV